MNCLTNDKGELLEILQDDKEVLKGEFKVPLDGYYEIFNLQHYTQAVWDFELNKWVGLGKPNISPISEPTIEPKDILIAELSIALAETQAQGIQAIAELKEAIARL